MVLGQGDPTPETLANAIRKFYGDRADGVVKAYAANTPEEVYEAAMHLASARFISHGTWKWTELQVKTGGKPAYRYLYARPRPPYLGMPGQTPPPSPPSAGLPAGPRGAAHSAEIQYAMGNLDLDKRYSWEPADYEVSKLMQAYFVNFIKTADPNGPGLPKWPTYGAENNYQLMRIDCGIPGRTRTAPRPLPGDRRGHGEAIVGLDAQANAFPYSASKRLHAFSA